MLTVYERVEKIDIGEVINLAKSEKALCQKDGETYARFENGQLVELFTPQYIPGQARNFVQAVFDWLANAQGEIWFVVISGDQLCSPKKVTTEKSQWFADEWRLQSENIHNNVK